MVKSKCFMCSHVHDAFLLFIEISTSFVPPHSVAVVHSIDQVIDQCCGAFIIFCLTRLGVAEWRAGGWLPDLERR